MAILLLNQDIDGKIQFVGNQIFEIEFLLSEAPKRLESYNTALNILKALKRGIPRAEAMQTWCSECCPPGNNPVNGCQQHSCPICWQTYIDSIKPEKREET